MNYLVLTPLNRVEINTLLNKLPQRTQLSQERHPLLDCVQDVINFRVSREAANAKADTAVCALIAAAESSKNVAWLKRRRSTSTPRRKSNIFQRHKK